MVVGVPVGSSVDDWVEERVGEEMVGQLVAGEETEAVPSDWIVRPKGQ